MRILRIYTLVSSANNDCVCVCTSVRGIRCLLRALSSLTAEDQILFKNMQELRLLPLLQRTTAAIMKPHLMQPLNHTLPPLWSCYAGAQKQTHEVLMLHKLAHVHPREKRPEG